MTNYKNAYSSFTLYETITTVYGSYGRRYLNSAFYCLKLFKKRKGKKKDFRVNFTIKSTFFYPANKRQNYQLEMIKTLHIIITGDGKCDVHCHKCASRRLYPEKYFNYFNKRLSTYFQTRKRDIHREKKKLPKYSHIAH